VLKQWQTSTHARMQCRRKHADGSTAISEVVVPESPPELLVKFSLGDSTSLLRLWSRFCSELCVSCPALRCNWIITCRAATVSSSSSFTVRGRHAWCPQRLSAYLALLIARQKCSMGQGTRQLERPTPGRSSCQSVRLGRGKRSKILAFVPFQCCLSPASCASETKPAPLTAKRRHLWTISFFPLSISWFFCFFFPLMMKNMGRNQRDNECQRLRVSYDANQAMRRRSPPHQQTRGHKTRPHLPPAC